MKVSYQESAGVNILTINLEEIDASNADDLRKEIEAVMDPSIDTVFDLEKVDFLDSSGLGVIISCIRRLAAHDAVLKLCNVNSSVRAILELVRFHRVVDIYETCNEAMRS